MPDVHTFGRTLAEAAANAHEAIAVTLDALDFDIEFKS